MIPDMSGTSPSRLSKSWTCQDFISPYWAVMFSHCSVDVSMSIRKVLTSLLRITTFPPSRGNGPRCTKSGSYSFAVKILTPHHPVSCLVLYHVVFSNSPSTRHESLIQGYLPPSSSSRLAHQAQGGRTGHHRVSYAPKSTQTRHECCVSQVQSQS